MQSVMTLDPFIAAVEDAKRELTRRNGREVTNADLVRLTGIPKSTLYYHLNARMERQVHEVPDDIIRALAKVLPIAEGELRRAAQVAAGYQVDGSSDERDYGFEVARFLDSDHVSEADKAELAVRLQQILAEHWARDVASRHPRNRQ